MNDTRVAPGGRAPWHLWPVGVLMVVWNAASCYNHVMTLTQNAAHFRVAGMVLYSLRLKQRGVLR